MYDYRVALLFMIGLYVFSPIIIDWWLAPDGAWYTPFAFWLLLIAVYAWVGSKRGHDEF
jgi:hypothetical protein|tara:strand:- start:1766 stop:1942 length:177 start_codon:yes stop_codon:yes gene_type:complete